MLAGLLRLPAFVLLVIASVMMAACSGGGPKIGGNGGFTETTPTSGAQPLNSTASSSAARIFAANSIPGDGKDEDYKIAPLDLLEISVFGVNDLNRSVQVSSTGMISLPLIKTVKAGGLTANQLEQSIAAKLGQSYLQSPQVSVFVKEYNSQRITVDGAVQKPGIFPIIGKVSLLQAIALAQGLTNVADPSAVIVFRTVGEKRMAARFDLQMVRTGKIDDPFLQAGDIVMVDESKARTTIRDITSVLPITGLFQLLAL